MDDHKPLRAEDMGALVDLIGEYQARVDMLRGRLGAAVLSLHVKAEEALNQRDEAIWFQRPYGMGQGHQGKAAAYAEAAAMIDDILRGDDKRVSPPKEAT